MFEATMKKFKNKFKKFYWFLFRILTGITKNSCSNGSHPTQYIFPNGDIFGVFYDSHSKKYHLANYIPYEVPPRNSVCKEAYNFSPSGNEPNPCSVCYNHLLKFCRFKFLAKFLLCKLISKKLE
jgi:hypothetical protein